MCLEHDYEENISKLEEEKARRRGRVFNWQISKYGKIRVDDDLYELRSMEAEFPAIVIDDAFTPQDALPCKSQAKNSTLLYKSRKTTVPFPSRLDNHYCEEEEGNYGPKFTKAYEASHINNTIPRKEKDPGSFTLPCFINNICFDNALVDLGASVSVMPLLTYLNLGLGELAHTRLTVELADRTVKYPKGIAENVLVEIVLEDMDAYRDEGMGDIIVGEPFFREVRYKAKRFEGIITLYNGDDEVSEKDVKNGISHAYQKLKGFYKGVLNLGPNYIRNAKTEEWLTRGHVSVHETK
ncbi:NUDIX hydrolase 6-like protein [Tanacetum coccineum]